MHNSKQQSTKTGSSLTSSPAKNDASTNSQPSLSEKQRETNNAFFRKMVNDRNKKLEELQQTHTTLQTNATKISESDKDDQTNKASLAFMLLGELIDECIYDVVFEAHRNIKQANSVCQICQTRCRSYVSRAGCDVFGNSYAANNLPSYECVNCHKMIAAGRYAPHLEKCLGLAGRQSSRVANRRLGSSSPYASTPTSVDDSTHALSDPESDKKKKRPIQSTSNGISRVKKLKNASMSEKP
ncbi:hypothetical protein K492DRAFT_238062 [Lichtheimia hyalospora FSU 10163]|nr:hypothetical protein K492DRAFT_238062 [Lichtheimia hyalospora FSU 10163]